MKIRDLLILAGCLGAASHASALSLGPSQGNVILGSPLDLSFQVRPDAGLTAEHSCITAAIRMGDNLVADSTVNVLFNGSDRVRIRGRHPVNEPVVTIELSAGCENTVRRAYTFFSDPPQEFIHSAAPLQLPAPPPVVSIPVDSPAVRQVAPRAERPSTASNAATATRAQATRPAPAAPQPKATPPAPAKAAPAPQAAAQPAPKPQAPAPTVAPATESAPAAAATPAAPAPTPTGESKPTLRMEALENVGATPAPGSAGAASTPAAATTAGQAATAGPDGSPLQPTTAQPNDSTADASATAALSDPRMAQLESMLQRMLDQQKLDRAQMLALQAQLQEAQTPQGLPTWVLAMMGLLGLSAGTILWLLHRVRTEKANSERWAHAVHTATTTPAAPVAAPPAPPIAPAAAASAAPDSALYPAAQAPLSSGTVLPVTTTASAAVAAPSHLLPLESEHTFASVQEQAEFFSSLGQHQQAIELLQNHLLQNGRHSPKGYLWLLKLLAEQGQHEEFARTRANFEQRFNVVVPESTAYHRKGRSLQEGYADTLEQIEAAWPHSDTLTLLRSLLTRTEHGPAAQRRFELQAFDELLALYHAAASTPPAQRGALPLQRTTSSTTATDAAAAPTVLTPTTQVPAQPLQAPALSPALPAATVTAAAVTPLESGTATATEAAFPQSTSLDASTPWSPPATPDAHAISLDDLHDSLMHMAPAVTTFAPSAPAFAPATTGAPSWVTQAAPSASEASLELPPLQGLEMLQTPTAAPSVSSAVPAAAHSPFGGPQLHVADDALLQSLQLDLNDAPASIASTPSGQVSIPMATSNSSAMPMLDLNDFLSSTPPPEATPGASATLDFAPDDNAKAPARDAT